MVLSSLVGLVGALDVGRSRWPDAVPAPLRLAGLLVLEDRYLQQHMAGYPEYTRRVPYRLIPGIW